MKQNYFDKFLMFLIVLLIGFTIFLQITTMENTKNLQNAEIERSKQYAHKIVTLLQMTAGENLEEALNNNQILRESLNKILQAFLTEQYQYIFLLHRDEKQKYHFLVDASKDDGVRYKEYFFPKSPKFNYIYETGKMEIVEQNDIENEELWVSLVYPILHEKEVKGLLVLDLSKEYAAYLQKFNSSLIQVINFIQWFLALTLVLLLFLGYRYYKIRKSLTRDKLTAMYTKYYLNEFFHSNSIDKYHVLLLDIDGFKLINNKYDRHIGDKVLLSFVDRLVKQLPEKSKVIRLGGSEFFMIIPKKQVENLKSFADDLYSDLSKKPYAILDKNIFLSLSMVMMNTPPKVDKIDNILGLLDEELLKIKKTGKNRVEVLEKITFSDVKYTSLEYIKEALDEERFTCLYQPICETKTKKVVKYEVLVRMLDKEDRTKLVTPKYFLSTIRYTSHYTKLSKLVLSHLFGTLAKYSEIELSMNLDLDDLDNLDTMELIGSYLEEHKANASRLTFEILEKSEIYDYQKVNKVFSQLRKFGSKIAIDDFGSGYANYTYLSRLDIDIIKLDANFVHDLEYREKQTKMVIESIQTLATKLGCQVVAEFVHSESVYLMLKDIGVEFSQGYYLGKPKRIEAYIT